MAEEVKTEPITADPEPEGVIEIPAEAGAKQKVVPVTVLTAERERIRKQADEKYTKDIEALKQKAALADQLQADLQSLQPHIEHLKKHPELLKADEPPEIAAISTEEAEQYARDYELYNARGLDIDRAKRMLAREHRKVTQAAKQAAQEAVQPVAQQTARDRSMANFSAAYYAKDASGRPLVDPQILTEVWKQVPVEQSADPQVAQVLLNMAIGQMHRSGKQPPAPIEHEPVFTEAPGGRGGSYQISDMERMMAKTIGVSEKDWQKHASTFKPGTINVIGE